MAEENTNEENTKLVGLLAQFDDTDSLLDACNQCREAGYTKTDAYSPFPVHGIDPALGIKRSILPFIVLSVGISGLFIGLGLQFFANSNAFDDISPFKGYGYYIGGKPMFSVPANIPVTFEIIVLSSAFATFLGMWFLNRLPRFSNPLHRISRFKRVTNDKFFLMVEAADSKFSRSETETQLNQWGAVAIEECREDLTDTKMPKWLSMAGIMVAILLLLPPVMIFRAKGMVNNRPRLHFNPDMDWQIKFKPQTVSPIADNESAPYLFSDMRSMRQPVAGSVPFGELEADSKFFHGLKDGQEATKDGEEDLAAYVSEFPKGLVIDEEFLARGKLRFEIYCTACHGYAGQGDGLVNARAMALGQSGKATWTTAKSLHDPVVKDLKQNPVGRLYDTISNGRGTMGPYRAQITPEDRWAIVAYIKALQATGLPVTAGMDAEAEASDATTEEEPATEETATEETQPETASGDSGSDDDAATEEDK
jgi:mono/diheme cytochrome c family protein